MVMFSSPDPTRSVRSGSRRAGWALLLVTVFAAAGVSLVPAPYVINQPGPTYDTLGDVQVDDHEVPLITVHGEPEHPELAEIRMTTVTRLGSPESLPSWGEVIAAWLSPERAILPVEQAFPPGLTYEQTREAARIDMQNSQQEAIAAALGYLDIPYDSFLVVVQAMEGGPSEGVFEPGDIVLRAGGVEVRDVTKLRALIADNGTQTPIDIVVDRDGVELDLQVLPKMSDGPEPFPAVGVLVSGQYSFPVDVEIQLSNVGGPSAGLPFALGIIERMTDELIADSLMISATGTISADGTVGGVGGVLQKAYGASAAGSEYFLIPRSNCDLVPQESVRGTRIVPVNSLSEAIDVLDKIQQGESLPSCTQPQGASPSEESQGVGAKGL